MWEITLFDCGMEAGTFDFFSPAIAVGSTLTDAQGSYRITEVRAVDPAAQTASVAVEYL